MEYKGYAPRITCKNFDFMNDDYWPLGSDPGLSVISNIFVKHTEDSNLLYRKVNGSFLSFDFF
jgi:hypothetical protein